MPQIQLADGQRLHYHDLHPRHGRGAPPLVLLHGFGMQASWWRPLLAGLGLRRRIILPDLRGFGGSHQARYSREDVISQGADDLAALLDALQLDQVALAGLSMGACVSMSYLAQHGGERVERYLNIDQAPRVTNQDDWSWGLFGPQQAQRYGDFRTLLKAIDGVGRPADYRQLPRRLRWQLERSFAQFFADAFAGRAQQISMQIGFGMPLLNQRLLPRQNWHAYLDCMSAYTRHNYDFSAGIAQLDAPLGVMIGTRSKLYPAPGQYAFARLAPHSRFIEFHGAGHALPFEQPVRFRSELKRFLS